MATGDKSPIQGSILFPCAHMRLSFAHHTKYRVDRPFRYDLEAEASFVGLEARALDRDTLRLSSRAGISLDTMLN